MEFLKESEFRKEIKGTPRVGYLFFGEEDYLKAFAVRTAREQLCPDPTFAFFNEMRIDVPDFTPQKLLEALMPLPMMSDRKLITVGGLRLTSMRQDELDSLCEILATLSEYDYNVVILNVPSDGLELPFSFPKKVPPALAALSQYLTPVYFERNTTAKLVSWIQKHFAHNGVEASAALCTEMAEFCGHGMFILANEIDKLSFYLRSQSRTVADSESMHYVCTPANEYDTFAFTNAVMKGESDVALGILADYRFRRIDPRFVLGDVVKVVWSLIAVQSMSQQGASVKEISQALGGMHEYKVGLYQRCLHNTTPERLLAALDACDRADTVLKDITTPGIIPPGYAPLERLICAI